MRPKWKLTGSERGGHGAVLADKDARAEREKGTEQQNQEVQMSHAGKNYVGPQLPYETQETKSSVANPACAKRMNNHPGGNRARVVRSFGDQSKVKIVLFSGQVFCEQGGHMYRAATAEMWDKKQNSGPSHNLSMSQNGTGQMRQIEVMARTI